MQTTKSRLDKAGRVFIPSEYRRELQLEVGAEVMLKLENGEIKICSFNESVQRLRNLVKQHNVDNVNLLEVLYKMRREEANHD